MKSWFPLVSMVLVGLLVVAGVAAAQGDPEPSDPRQPLPPTPHYTPGTDSINPKAPVVTDAPQEPKEGSGPGITVGGRWVPLPAEAKITTYFVNFAPGVPAEADLPILVTLGTSEVEFRPSGTLIESRVQAEHVDDLKPLMDALVR